MSRNVALLRSHMATNARALPGLKLVLTLAVTLLFCVPYFWLQRLGMDSPRRLPLSSVDAAVPFSPGWIWGYQSAYVLYTGSFWLRSTRRELLEMAAGFLAVSAVGFVCFLLWPVTCPRPLEATEGHWLYGLVVSYDGPTNAFPSLHCALTVYCAIAAARVVGPESVGPRSAALARVGLVLWAVAIVYSTLATKQHYAVDVAAGCLLGAAGAFCTARLSQRQVVDSASVSISVPRLPLERSVPR